MLLRSKYYSIDKYKIVIGLQQYGIILLILIFVNV